MKEATKDNFIQRNSPDGGFLQSEQWRKFQESVGKKTFNISSDNFWANIIQHQLPVVGKYFYIPRGPLGGANMGDVLALAKKEQAGWIRIDADYKNENYKIVKAPHDMQPQELFIIDITKPEEQLLVEMKPKTRYNIKLAEKKAVRVFDSREEKYLDKFCELVKVTAQRDGITPHPESYYRQMFKTIPAENLRLYVAEYKDKIIAANLVVFYGGTATYLHGASDNESRNVMAPYLLQWRQIQDAKAADCTKYDFGGVKTDDGDKSWAGITKFKTGFSPTTEAVEFPGSYDIVIDPVRYGLYRLIQKAKNILG
jgi:lipid II:glycine glycyltransferase (peptidoglycan interpeptide bridge formation enzyme)